MINEYKKRPLTAHAVQYTGENLEEVKDFCEKHDVAVRVLGSKYVGLCLDSLQGVPPGLWVVRQMNGEFRVYSPEKFNLLYEEN
jgi:hypothetical protein